ncbi:MAG: flagellar hook-associated protein FlgK [Pseudomonadota bacterium]
MSISTALANATSGLMVSSRLAEVVSNNVANALTPGYTRQTADVGSVVVNGRGAGAQVVGVSLAGDAALVAASRRGAAQSAALAQEAATATALADAFGRYEGGDTLNTRVTAFEAALVETANTPSSTAAQSDLLTAAQGVTDMLNQISTENRRLRMDADAEIASQVGEINAALKEISSLNREIQMRAARGGETASLQDLRDSLVDDVSSRLPVRTQPRSDGQIAVYTAQGQPLVDGPAAELGFAPAGVITPDMTLASGAVSGVTLNGQPMALAPTPGLAGGGEGTLAALLKTRDETVPQADAQLDALAADLIGRLQSSTVDSTLAPGDPGLFTDGGAALASPYTPGLAGRITVNTAVDPAQGGELYRLRDGINAIQPGLAGDTSLLTAQSVALSATTAPPAGLNLSTQSGFAGFVAELTGMRDASASQAEQAATRSAATQDILEQDRASASGVDTDAELQALLAIEQAYAANARVISVADNLLQTVLEI